MESATAVSVTCPDIGLKNHPGALVAISPQGYYEIDLDFAERGVYKALLPIAGTVLLAREPNPRVQTLAGIER